MLVLSVDLDEQCELDLGGGETVRVTLVAVRGRSPAGRTRARLGFDAPKHVQIASPTTLRKRAALAAEQAMFSFDA